MLEGDGGLEPIEVAEVPVTAAPAPPAAIIKTGLSLVIDIAPGFTPLKQGLANVWEDVAEDISALLIKKIIRRDGLGMKSGAQYSDRGHVKLTLSLTSDA